MRNLLVSLILYFFLSLFNHVLYSQGIKNGQFVIRGNGDDLGSNVIQLADSNYLYCGTTSTYGNGGKDILLVKFQSDLSILWQKTLGGGNDEYVYDRQVCVENSDGTIMVVGNSSSGLIGGVDILLVKLDASGNILWNKVYGGGNNERGMTLEKDLDGGYILGGNTYSFPNGNNNLYVIKVDALGNTVWNWSFGNTSRLATQVTDIITLPDSSYVFSGFYDGAPSNGNGFIGRLDKNGILLWIKRYVYGNNQGWEGIHSLKLINSNTIIASGVTRGASLSGTSDGLMISIDFNGVVNWSKVYGGTGDEWFYFIDTDGNQDITSIVYTSSVTFGSFDMALIKTNLLGQVLDYKVFGSSGLEHGKFYSQTNDGGVVFTGNTTGFSSVGRDSYIVKIDNKWSSGCNEASELINASTVVLNPQDIAAPQNTNGGEQTASLMTNTPSILIDTLCIDTLNGCNIIANFSSSINCLGDSTIFSDLSINTVGNIVNWQWYFGDGDSIIGVENPAHLYSNSGDYNVTLVVTNDSNCIDSITISVLVYQVFDTTITETICQGDSIFLGGAYRTVSGNYVDSLQTVFGCDSVVNSDLIVHPTYSNVQNQTICQGDSILFGSNFYYTTGFYIDSLQTNYGCDSLLILNLTVNPSFSFNQNVFICSGDSAYLGGAFQTISGNYTDRLQTSLGCDSLIITTLIVGDTSNNEITVNICQGDSLFLEGNYQKTSGVYVDSLYSFLGCDSIVTTNLIVNTYPVIKASEDTTVMVCDAVQLNVTGGTSYNWTPIGNLSCSNCADPIAFPYKTTNYYVVANNNGCLSRDTVLIMVEGELELFVPNVFTPNGDGENDGFNFVGGNCISFVDKKIFNRWGQLLFHSNLIDEGWNGNTNAGNEVPEGTYFYVFEIEQTISGVEKLNTYKGTVSLFR